MILSLIVTFAFAAAPADTGSRARVVLTDEQVDSLVEERAALEAQLAKAKADLAECEQAKAAAKRHATAKKPAAKQASAPVAVVIEPIAPPAAPAPDPAQELRDRIAKLEERLTALEGKDTVVNVTVTPPPAAPAPVAPVTVARREFHLVAFTGGAAVLSPPLPGVSGPVAGRLALGVRPEWELSKHWDFGLTLEGDTSLGGWGIRALPGVVAFTDKAGAFGAALGVGYNCDALGNEGCAAEHTGGVGRVTWEHGFGRAPVGIQVVGDLEVNYFEDAWNDSGPEVRGVLGANLLVGSPRPRKVPVATP